MYQIMNTDLSCLKSCKGPSEQNMRTVIHTESLHCTMHNTKDKISNLTSYSNRHMFYALINVFVETDNLQKTLSKDQPTQTITPEKK